MTDAELRVEALRRAAEDLKPSGCASTEMTVTRAEAYLKFLRSGPAPSDAPSSYTLTPAP